ncbi:UNVERIFIED_CONTAM: hypothetical protein FKN15_076387 [Acipenser sinensis]
MAPLLHEIGRGQQPRKIRLSVMAMTQRGTTPRCSSASVPWCFSPLVASAHSVLNRSLHRCRWCIGVLEPLCIGASTPSVDDVSDAISIMFSWDGDSLEQQETEVQEVTQETGPSSEPQRLTLPLGQARFEPPTTSRFPGRQCLNSAGLCSDRRKL